MNFILAIAAAVVGLVLSPVLVAVSVRALDGTPLLTRNDLRRPLRLPADIDARALPRWKLPVTMVATAVSFALAVPSLGGTWVVPAYLWFLAMTLVLTLTDLDDFLIPDRVIFPGTGIGAVLLAGGAALEGTWTDLGRALLGAVAYYVAWEVIYWMSRVLFGRGAFGYGDVKLAFTLGLFLTYFGWSLLIIGSVGSFILGGLVSLFLLVFRIRGRKDPIPFGPFMVAAAWIALFANEAITDWYNG